MIAFVDFKRASTFQSFLNFKIWSFFVTFSTCLHRYAESSLSHEVPVLPSYRIN